MLGGVALSKPYPTGSSPVLTTNIQKNMITKEEYEQLKEQHEQACKINDYSKMIMMGDENHKKMKEYESLTCKHTRITSHQGGQIDECLDCGKTWG